MTKAEEIARMVHATQRDRSGAPYIFHPERVAQAVARLGRDYEAAGWLHDVIEDGAETRNTLAAATNFAVALAVSIVSRRKDETYREFINRIAESENPIAIAVKLADLKDNLRPGGEALRSRYLPAIAQLEEANERLQIAYEQGLGPPPQGD